MAPLDWDDLRYVLAVARHGSLSAAARALAVTQPTVGRHCSEGARGQAAVESGWGKSAPCFNFFGIKAKVSDPEHT